jgi:hypothetical protein
MKKIVCCIILSVIGFGLISKTDAQIMGFPDVRTVGKFKLNVGVVILAKDSIYNSLSGKDGPDKYHSEFIFGKYTFLARIFDSNNKLVLIMSKSFASKDFGKYADQDGFLKSYDPKTNTEHYQYATQGYDISFQKTGSYANNWIKVHIVASLQVKAGQVTNKYMAFYGTGDFSYNTVTHEIKQD